MVVFLKWELLDGNRESVGMVGENCKCFKFGKLWVVNFNMYVKGVFFFGNVFIGVVLCL